MTMQPFNFGLEEQEPEAAFLRGLRQRFGYEPRGNIFGRYMQQQQPAYQNAFGFNQLLNPPGAAQSANPFEQYTAGNDLGGIRGSAYNLFNQLRTGQTGTAPGVRAQFQQPDESQASDLRNLAIQALLSRISPLALRMLNLPGGGQLRSEFLAEQPADNNFIEYARNRLGLGLL